MATELPVAELQHSHSFPQTAGDVSHKHLSRSVSQVLHTLQGCHQNETSLLMGREKSFIFPFVSKLCFILKVAGN